MHAARGAALLACLVQALAQDPSADVAFGIAQAACSAPATTLSMPTGHNSCISAPDPTLAGFGIMIRVECTADSVTITGLFGGCSGSQLAKGSGSYGSCIVADAPAFGLSVYVRVDRCFDFTTQCEYPCLPCAHGGQCNGTQMRESGGQAFGTCTGCDDGWGGPQCTDSTVTCGEPCMNGAQCAAGACQCPGTGWWTGSDCGTMVCPGGSPPPAVAPADPTYCAGCPQGRDSFLCRSCSGDDGCSGASTCSSSVAFRQDGRLACRITDDLLLTEMEADGGAVVFIRFYHNDTDGLSTSAVADGQSSFEVYRSHNYSGAMKLEQFFHCQSTGCSLRLVDSGGSTAPPPSNTRSPTPDGLTAAPLGLSVVLIVLLFVVAASGLLPARVGTPVCVAACTGVAVFLLALFVVDSDPDDSAAATPATNTSGLRAVYSCARSECSCGHQENRRCPTSLFGTGILPTVGAWTMECTDGATACALSVSGLLLPSVGVDNCVAAECVSPDSTSHTVGTSTDSGSGGEAVLWIELSVVILLVLVAAASLVYEVRWTQRCAEAWRRDYSDHSDREMGDRAHAHPALRIDGASRAVQGKPLLNDVSLRCEHGGSVAVMGPSGAGKSSLLLLAARRHVAGDTRGRFTALGVDASESGAEYLRRLRFCGDHPPLLPSLTPRQHLRYAADFGLPIGVPDDVRRARADRLLTDLGLQGVADRTIGTHSGHGLSTGERRRLSVAAQLISNPSVLLADEPTSGLDAVNAGLIAKMLAGGGACLARLEVQDRYMGFFGSPPAAILSIHQPTADIFSGLDQLLVLSKGRCVYYGPAAEAADALSREHQMVDRSGFKNPADYVAAVAAALDNHGGPLQQVGGGAGHSPAAGERPSVSLGSCSYPGFWSQLRLLARRNIDTLLGDRMLLSAHAFICGFFSLWTALLYDAQDYTLSGVLNRAGAVTFLLSLVSLSSLSSLEVVMGERDVVAEERGNQAYGALPYFLMRVVFDYVPLRVLPSATLAAITYYSVGFRTDNGYNGLVHFVGIVTLFACTVTSMCFCVAAAAPSRGAGLLLASVAVLYFLMFGGLLLQPGEARGDTASVLRWTSPFALAFEPLMVRELEGQRCSFQPEDEKGGDAGTEIVVLCAQYLTNLDLDASKEAGDVAVLIAWFAGYTALAFALVYVGGRSA